MRWPRTAIIHLASCDACCPAMRAFHPPARSPRSTGRCSMASTSPTRGRGRRTATPRWLTIAMRRPGRPLRACSTRPAIAAAPRMRWSSPRGFCPGTERSGLVECVADEDRAAGRALGTDELDDLAVAGGDVDELEWPGHRLAGGRGAEPLDPSPGGGRPRHALGVDQRERPRLVRRDPQRLRAQIADVRPGGVAELTAERDVGALGRGVLGVDQDEARGALELAIADHVGAKPRIGRDVDRIEVQVVRRLAVAAAGQPERARDADPDDRGECGAGIRHAPHACGYPTRITAGQAARDHAARVRSAPPTRPRPAPGSCIRSTSRTLGGNSTAVSPPSPDSFMTRASAVARVVTRSSAEARLSTMIRYSPFTRHRPPWTTLVCSGS